jgi:iron-sulfur cluster assembly accessory protein
MNGKANINITPTASSHIRGQLQQTQAQFLRLGVKESGCNGYMYMLDYLELPAEDDECFDFGDGVRICVSLADMEMVRGTEVDMITEGLNSALVFKNPNATSYCGCGESFAVGSAQDTEMGVDAAGLATDVGTN